MSNNYPSKKDELINAGISVFIGGTALALLWCLMRKDDVYHANLLNQYNGVARNILVENIKGEIPKKMNGLLPQIGDTIMVLFHSSGKYMGYELIDPNNPQDIDVSYFSHYMYGKAVITKVLE